MIELLLNASLYDPAPRGRQNLAICGERVLWIGEGEPPIAAELVSGTTDLTGYRLIPGLIDGHVHLTGGGGESGPQSRVPPLPLSRFTRHGITSVVGLLGTDDLTRTTGGLVTTARGLVEEGLSAWCYTGGYHLPPATLTGSVRGDIAYIDRVIGVGELAVSDHRSSQPTLDELLRVASEAHVAGLMTGKAGTVHLHMGDGVRGLALIGEALDRSEIPARVFHPTHVNRRRSLLDEALVLAERGPSIDVTAFPPPADNDSDDANPEVLADDAICEFLDSNLPPNRLTVSSDGGGCLPTFDQDGRITSMETGDPGALADCLGRLLARGRALEEILPPFTTNVADLLRLPGKGRVAVGADADLVALDENGAIGHVMARGRWHVTHGRLVRTGTFERTDQR